MRGKEWGGRQWIGNDGVEIDLGVEFVGFPAEDGDVGDTGHDAQLAFDHPVLERLEPHDVHAQRPRQLVAKDLADAPGGRDNWLDTGWQDRILQPVECLLTHEMIVAAVFELQADETESIYRVRADEPQTCRA